MSDQPLADDRGDEALLHALFATADSAPEQAEGFDQDSALARFTAWLAEHASAEAEPASAGASRSTGRTVFADASGLSELRERVATLTVEPDQQVPPHRTARRTGLKFGGDRSRWSTTWSPTASNPKPAPDAESARMLALVERAQDGNGEAFGKLYDDYWDTVYRYIYYRVSSKALAEDLTQETFLCALRRISTFTWQGRDFGAWLVTIARNLVADHFKSSRHRLEVPTGEMLDSDQHEPSPEESVLSYLSNRALLDAVKQLNSQQQECVTLRFLHGLSVAETAQIMGKNIQAVQILQYRAIQTLSQLLPGELR